MDKLEIVVENRGCTRLLHRLTSGVEQLNSCESVEQFEYYKGLCTGLVDGLLMFGFISQKNHYDLYSKLHECKFDTFERILG